MCSTWFVLDRLPQYTMVLLGQARDCLCGAFIGIRQQCAHGATKNYNGPVAGLPSSLPRSTELPARLAAELRVASGGGNRQCAIAGVAGPVLAVLLGGADGLGFDDLQRERLHVACRRELRQLERALGTQRVALGQTGTKAVGTPAGARADAFDVAVHWCSTPVLPTYSVGVHMVLGVEDGAMRCMATDLAWVFRLMCARTRIDSKKEAPMLSKACEVLCGNADAREGLQKAVAIGAELNRSTSLAPSPMGEEGGELPGEGRWWRSLSEGAADLDKPTKHHLTSNL